MFNWKFVNVSGSSFSGTRGSGRKVCRLETGRCSRKNLEDFCRKSVSKVTGYEAGTRRFVANQLTGDSECARGIGNFSFMFPCIIYQ
jgi:hypothetical protein